MAERSFGTRLGWALAGMNNPDFGFKMLEKERLDKEKADEERKKLALSRLAEQMGGAVVPSEGMGPIQPINDPRSALAKIASITGDPSALINYNIRQNDPMRKLELQLKQAQLRKANAPDPIDLKKLAENYALKKAAGIKPALEEEMGAKAWESINRGEIDYDPDTGQPRPKYQSLFGDTALGRIQPVDLENVQMGDAALDRPPMPGEMSALSKAGQLPPMPEGLYPKAQLEFQKEAVKDIFEAPEKIEAEKKRAETLKTTVSEIDNIVIPAIDNAIKILDKPMTSGIQAQATQFIGGSPAYSLKQAITPVQSATGLGKLIQMKESSPTGASGFGSLSAPELNLLLNRVRSLDIGQRDEDLKKNLIETRKEFLRQRDKASGGYSDITGESLPSFFKEKNAGGWSIEKVE